MVIGGDPAILVIIILSIVRAYDYIQYWLTGNKDRFERRVIHKKCLCTECEVIGTPTSDRRDIQDGTRRTILKKRWLPLR